MDRLAKDQALFVPCRTCEDLEKRIGFAITEIYARYPRALSDLRDESDLTIYGVTSMNVQFMTLLFKVAYSQPLRAIELYQAISILAANSVEQQKQTKLSTCCSLL